MSLLAKEINSRDIFYMLRPRLSPNFYTDEGEHNYLQFFAEIFSANATYLVCEEMDSEK